MSGRTPPRGATDSKMSRHGKMSARWNRAFAVLLLLSLTTAVLSFVVVQRVESMFASATNEVTRETAAYDQLVGGLGAEASLGHLMLDTGSVTSGAFLGADAALGAAFTAALTTYNADAERALLRDAQAQWQEAFAALRILVADPAQADASAATLGQVRDLAHSELGKGVDATSVTLHQLDLSSRSALQETLNSAHGDKTQLLILLAAIFTLSVCATIVYARRMATRVVRPIRTLWESADRFGAGELDHRVDLHNDDEIGELADRFNVMADTIASTHRHLTVQAHHDALTGLVNRAGFVGRLDAAIDPEGPHTGSVSLMFIDLDDFKHVNDDLGHAAGDELLRQVADRLRGTARSSDVVCRLGGDEFAVLVGSSPEGEAVAVEMAERVLSVLEQPFSVHGSLIRVGASIGIASQTSEDDSGDYLLRAADVAMYSAKGQGKHRWQMFDPAIHGPVVADVSAILARLEAGDLDDSRPPSEHDEPTPTSRPG
jgi:diguanylate cyclase (GGDEF)-like protein